MVRPLHEVWEAEADAWAQWVRTPGHDEWHWRLNWPAFLELLPAPGRLTFDLGCGEGRGGVALRERGHRMVGVDAAPVSAFPPLAKARRRPTFLHIVAVQSER